MEEQYQQSSYRYLSLVMPETWRYLQSGYRMQYEKLGDPNIDWKAVDEGSDNQPWQIVVEQGLALCCGDLIKRNLYKLLGHGQDISLVLIKDRKYVRDFDPQFTDQFIRLLIQSGSVVSQRNILECLYVGTASALDLLLDTQPKGAIQLYRENLFISLPSDDVREDTYDGEAVGPLWELARSGRFEDEFETMLDLLLARGERLDQSCGPGGTMLHALILRNLKDVEYVEYLDHIHRVKLLLERGVNVNVRIS